jgi:hypothetical protein
MSFQQRLPDSGHREAKVALAPHSSLYQRTRSPERNVGEVMQVLLSEKSVEVHITPEVVIAAAKNGGRHMIQLLLKERSDDVHITLEVVLAAAERIGDRGALLNKSNRMLQR